MHPRREEFDCVIGMICFEPEQAQIAIDAFAVGHTQHFVFCSTVDAYTKDPKNYPISRILRKTQGRNFRMPTARRSVKI